MDSMTGDTNELEFEDRHTPVKKQAWSNEKKESEIPCLKKLLRPYLYSLALIGSYNFNDINNCMPQRNKLKSVLGVVYRVFILLIMLANCARSTAAFFYLPRKSYMFNGLFLGWFIYTLMTYIVLFKASSLKYGHLEQAFVFWNEKIAPDFRELEIKLPVQKIRKRSAIVLVISWLIVVGNVSGCGVQMYLFGPDLLTSPFEGTPVIIVLYFTCFSIPSGLWLVPIGYIIMLNTILYEAFNAFTDFSGRHCAKNGCQMAEDFQKIRLLHKNLCKLVKMLDEDLSWFYACVFTFSIGLAVFDLYQIIKTSLHLYELILLLFWFFSALIIAAMYAFKAAYVNDAAHAPLDFIYDINVSDITVEKLAQLNLYLSKLTGTQVGFTCCGFFVITKEFILTIAGVFLTYFAVLYTL